MRFSLPLNEENRERFGLPKPPLKRSQRNKLFRKVCSLSLDRYRRMQSRTNIRLGKSGQGDFANKVLEQMNREIKRWTEEFDLVYQTLLAGLS